MKKYLKYLTLLILLLIPVLCLGWGITTFSGSAPAGTPSDSGIFYPGVSGDDGYEVGGGGWDTSGDFIGFGKNVSVLENSFIRFPSITIPQGATIVSAFVRFTAYSNYSSVDCNVSCYFNAIDDAVAPATLVAFQGLAWGDVVPWDNIATWLLGLQYDSPDLSDILQPIMDRLGWASGNAVLVGLFNNNSSNNHIRRARSIDYAAGVDKAEIHVRWTP